MAADRQFQQIIDRTIKKIDKGHDFFQSMWQKIEAQDPMVRPQEGQPGTMVLFLLHAHVHIIALLSPVLQFVSNMLHSCRCNDISAAPQLLHQKLSLSKGGHHCAQTCTTEQYLQVMNQTERFAGDLRKELAKQQREREKVRAWLTDCRPELAPRLEVAKEKVEESMYKFRAFEKAWKHRRGVFAIGDVRSVLHWS